MNTGVLSRGLYKRGLASLGCQSFFFPSALDDFSIELSFGVVSKPSAVMGLVATVGTEVT